MALTRQLYRRVYFEGIICPSVRMTREKYDALADYVIRLNRERSLSFDSVAKWIIDRCDGDDVLYFSHWFGREIKCYESNSTNLRWLKGELRVAIERGNSDDCDIARFSKPSYDIKTTERPEDKVVAYSANDVLYTELAMRRLMNSTYGIPTSLVRIMDVIFNDPATIVFWSDGTKTVCTCSEADTYDPEKGLALCCMKKLLYKNKGHIFNNAREKWLKKVKKHG